MKCRICGFKTQYIENMAKHYRSAHPESMKRRKKHYTKEKFTRETGEYPRERMQYCPHCGKRF